MSSGITLSAGVRQNLLSLQNTASLMATTQNRLATGKKVNSALDNPSNFFTSQSLSDRASDLNSLLDSIGQATKTLQAADNGITSITNLVQSAKSIAQQARQATSAVSTYSAVDSSSNILSSTNLNGAESVASKTGTSRNLEATAIAVTGANVTETTATTAATTATTDAALTALNTGAGVTAGTLRISVNTRNGAVANFDVALNGQKLQSTVKAAIDGTTATVNGTAGVALSSLVDVSYVANKLTLTAKTSATDFKIQDSSNGSTAGTLTDVGLTGAEVGAQKNSSSLFDQILANGGAQGNTLVISGTNSDGTAFASQTITFGTGASDANTLADLNTQLGSAATASSGAFSAAVTSTHISITKPAGTKSSVSVGGTVATITANATLLEGGTAGTVFSTHNSQPTVADLGKTLGGGSGGPVDLTAGGSLSFTVNSQNYTVGLQATDRLDDVVSKLSTSSLASSLTFTKVTDGSGHDHVKVNAKDSSVDFTINANGTSAAVGLTADTTTASVNNSTSLLDLLDTSFGGAGNASGKTLTVAANGGSTQTITFGTGTGQVQTVAQLNTALQGLSGVTASVSNAGALDINVASGTSATNLTIGGSAAGKLGLTAATQSGTVLSTTANSTRTSLQTDFNNVLDADRPAGEGCLLQRHQPAQRRQPQGDVQREGTSSLTITGVSFNCPALGLQRSPARVPGQHQINTTISSIDTALSTTLRTQSSKFGSNLTTVQTRQDFTKNVINTLQTGCRQPRARRHQRRRRQPAGPADPPAALDHRALARQPGEPGGAAVVLIHPGYGRFENGGASAPPFFLFSAAFPRAFLPFVDFSPSLILR